MKTGKIWGETALLLANPFVEVHRLKVKPQHRCSMHVHARKANAFLVLRGRLFVDVRKKAYELTDVTELRAGEHTIVPAGEWHRFRTGKEGCELLELYWPEPLGDDIVREDAGGRA